MSPDEQAPSAMVQSSKYASGTALVSIAVALLVSVALNVLLARKVRALNGVLSTRMSERVLKVGSTVPSIPARGLDGHQEVISYQGTNQPTVLYIFTPQCPWCARNMDNFNALVASGGGKYRFVGLSLSEEGLSEYVRKNGLTLPVYSGLSAQVPEAYRLSGTPQTIVVSPEGRVLQTWVGAYVGGRKSQVEAFFHVTLPGIRSPSLDLVPQTEHHAGLP